MAKRFPMWLATLTAGLTMLCALESMSASPNIPAILLKQKGRQTVTLALEFSKKNKTFAQRAFTPGGSTPNAYASGFFVGERLVMTSFHVVSGDLSQTRRERLGFKQDDDLMVDIWVNGCRANVLRTDKAADLALLGVCRVANPSDSIAFEHTPAKDDPLFLIAQPGPLKMIRNGHFVGEIQYRGQTYWGVKLEGQDGCSGGPVYNTKGEVVGIFSAYDWSNQLGIITPADRAEKLLFDYLTDHPTAIASKN